MSCVYFIKPVGLDGPIKIGCSKTPVKRVVDLGAWSPWPLEVMAAVPGNLADERFLHHCFAKSHSHREWFHSSPALRDMIAKIVAADSIQPAREALEPEGNILSLAQITRNREWSRRQRYSMRITWTEKRLRRQLGEDGLWHVPDDITEIMQRWQGTYARSTAPVEPMEADFARIDEYLADPAAHSVLPTWKRRAA